ncbi:MAG: trypsin-like serine protease [Myxococcota bacterium]
MADSMTLTLSASILAFGGGAPDALVQPSDPQSIVGGSLAEPCQWPSVVSILEDDETPVMCSGTLVHPQVVMTAAHCISDERPIVGLGFGEHGMDTGVPERVVAPIDCVGNPDYYFGNGADVGYCVLSELVHDVPIVPLMAGCEVEALVPGTEVFIIGYGADFGSYDPVADEVTATGVGPKRWTTQTVDFIDAQFQEINLVGDNGSQSACFGDSGGPAMVQMADGSWRVFGTGGHLYDPGNLPPPMIPDNICGAGAAYGFAPFVLDWLEQETGVDLTYCWDGDQWSPAPTCADFPLDPHMGAGTWATGCAGGSFGGGQPPACADVPPMPGTTDGGSSSSDDAGETTEGPAESSSGAPPPDPLDTSAGPVPPLPGGSGSTSDAPGSSGDAGEQDDDGLGGRGCSCRTSSDPAGAPALPWMVLMLAGLGRARRRSRR